ncbi:MAG: hypothetical protein RI580_12860, partial [Halothece sp. Uz-M2-17]|nr:hypothetical protein [Halothece sp. Uz-M2-17]
MILTILLQVNLAVIVPAGIPSVWSLTYAQSESNTNSQSSPSETGQFPVTLGDKTLFTIRTDLPRMQASQRARLASEEIQRIARDRDIPLNSIVARPVQEEEVYLISQIRNNEESQIIVLVNKNDAAIAQRPVSDLTNEWLEAIQDGIGEYRQQYSLRRRITGVIALAIATVALIILLRVTQRLLKTIQHSIDTWRETRVYPIRFRGLVIVSVNEQVLFAHSLISL